MLPRSAATNAAAASDAGDAGDADDAERRIIPLRRSGIGTESAWWLTPETGDMGPLPLAQAPLEQAPLERARLEQTRRQDAARHYLKFMLPAVPITAFVMTFLYCYLLVGIQAPAAASTADLGRAALVDPALPLLGALLLALSTAMLCGIIYWGYLRVCTSRA